MRKKNHILVYVISLIPLLTFSQKKDSTINIKEINGDLLTGNSKKTIVNNYKIFNNTQTDKILLLHKYINVEKEILIKYGSNEYYNSIQWMTKYPAKIQIDNNVITIKVKNGQLVIDCIIFGIDGDYLAKIENNHLLPSKDLDQYGSDRWLEVISRQNIPILQIELNKSKNCIEINGLFFGDSQYSILSKNGTEFFSDERPFMVMSDQERKTIFYGAVVKARKALTQLHNQ